MKYSFVMDHKSLWDEGGSSGGYYPSKGGIVFGLIADISLATKIAQAAKNNHLTVRNFDRSLSLLNFLKENKPMLVVLDWDRLEAEAFKVVKEFHGNPELQKIPTIGFASESKVAIRAEAQRAGCHRVYTKSEFQRTLPSILMRYAA